MLELAKIRAFDKLFDVTSVEEEDITTAFSAHNIAESKEFVAIMNEAKIKYDQKL